VAFWVALVVVNAAMFVSLSLDAVKIAVRFAFTVSLKWRSTRPVVDGMMFLAMAVMAHFGRLLRDVCL
jgi:hypothetical protein